MGIVIIVHVLKGSGTGPQLKKKLQVEETLWKQKVGKTESKYMH